MPKRNRQEKIDHYSRKIRRLQEKDLRRHQRVIDSSDGENNSDNELQIINGPMPMEDLEVPQVKDFVPIVDESIQGPSTAQEANDQEPAVPELDQDILSALGESTEDTPIFGEKIHDNLARLWQPILKKGLNKEAKVNVTKQYLIPENCKLLQAPKLNPEIAAAVSDATRLRDKKVEFIQQQLGLGITALNRGLSLLLEGDKDRVQAIKQLSDSCRILCDIHYMETQARTKFVTPGLDKAFINIINDVDRDEMLFGNQLSEKIKASKAIERQGLQIKKAAPAIKTLNMSSSQSTASRPRSQVNWTGPPRYPSNRGGRGGPKRTAPVGRRAPPAAQFKPSNYSRQRAPMQHH